MRVTIRPCMPAGTVAAPPSKSMAHRLLICAGLSPQESVIEHLAQSQDVLATLDCLRALGAEIHCAGSTARVRGVNPTARTAPALLPCRESGSTLRFFTPLCLCSSQPATLTGSATLLQRPLDIYASICAAQALGFQRTDEALTVQGRLQPGAFTVAGNVSSQFVSGLLFALPLLPGDSRITLLPPVESRPYIDMTLSALHQAGVCAAWEHETQLQIPGGQTYQPLRTRVEGDYSNAAFLEALNLLGGKVTVTGLSPDSLQGDRIYRVLFRQLLDGTPEIDLRDCPDLGPILFAMAAALHGASFTGTARLRIKESDRVEAMRQELSKFGCRMEIGADAVHIPAAPLHAPATPLEGHNDHRIVMTLAVLATRYGGEIRGAQAVTKSYPAFFETLAALQTEVTTDEMDQ